MIKKIATALNKNSTNNTRKIVFSTPPPTPHIKMTGRRKKLKQNNFTYLLFSLMLLLFSSAFIDQIFPESSGILSSGITVFAMSVNIWSMQASKSKYHTGVAIIAFSTFFTAFVLLLDALSLEIVHLLLMLGFFIFTVKKAAKQALFTDSITQNSIVGSVCIFLLLGLIWVMLYLLLYNFSPESFSGFTHITWQANFSDFIYFSFVSLTTLGYGEMLPISPLAKFLVYTEVIVGDFYMAIVVSSLVGTLLTTSLEKQRDND